MVGKMPNVTWPEGSFAETVKGWQSGWFYITETCDANWVAPPEFRSGIPMRLTSWQERGLTRGPSDELTRLQTCIQNMIERKIKLVNVVQVMLVRRVLPCQRRTCNLWEFEPAKHQTLLELFGMTHEEIWKVLFKAGETPPPTTEDRGLSLKRQPNPVSSFNVFKEHPLLAYFERKFKLPSPIFRPGLSWPRRLTVRSATRGPGISIIGED